jgi:hypothetical protein
MKAPDKKKKAAVRSIILLLFGCPLIANAACPSNRFCDVTGWTASSHTLPEYCVHVAAPAVLYTNSLHANVYRVFENELSPGARAECQNIKSYEGIHCLRLKASHQWPRPALTASDVHECANL